MSCSDYIVNTYSFTLRGAFESCLDPVADAGFKQFEVMMYPGHLWPSETTPGSLRQLRRALSSRGLSIASFNQPQIDINLSGATPEMRRYSIECLCGIIELAGELGVPAIQIGPGKVNHFMPSPREEALSRFFDALDILLPAANNAGTQLLIENMPHSFIPDAAGLVEAIERYGSAEIGMTYDVANGAFIGEDIGAALRRCGDRVRMIHLSDTTRESFAHDPIGCGTVDFKRVLAELSSSPWSGKPVLEIVTSSERQMEDIVGSVEALDRMGWGDEPNI